MLSLLLLALSSSNALALECTTQTPAKEAMTLNFTGDALPSTFPTQYVTSVKIGSDVSTHATVVQHSYGYDGEVKIVFFTSSNDDNFKFLVSTKDGKDFSGVMISKNNKNWSAPAVCTSKRSVYRDYAIQSLSTPQTDTAAYLEKTFKELGSGFYRRSEVILNSDVTLSDEERIALIDIVLDDNDFYGLVASPIVEYVRKNFGKEKHFAIYHKLMNTKPAEFSSVIFSELLNNTLELEDAQLKILFSVTLEPRSKWLSNNYENILLDVVQINKAHHWMSLENWKAFFANYLAEGQHYKKAERYFNENLEQIAKSALDCQTGSLIKSALSIPEFASFIKEKGAKVVKALPATCS